MSESYCVVLFLFLYFLFCVPNSCFVLLMHESEGVIYILTRYANRLCLYILCSH